jgi:DNA-binding protein H-NS
MQGYQLGADYTKKTQEVAEQRKAVEAEQQAIQEAKQVRDTYAQRLQAIEQFLTSGEDSPEDLAAMKENDPIGYAVKVAEMTEKKEQLTQVRAEQQRLAQQQQAEQQQYMAKHVQQEATKLSQVLPEFSDPTKGEQLRSEIRNYGKSVGFSDSELAQVYDSRHVLTLHKAMMYDKLQKSKPNVNKKVAQAPKMVKSGTKVKEGSRDLRKQQMNKLKQTGKARDAAALFENFIN